MNETNPLNIVLVLVIVTYAAGTLAAWLSPDVLRSLWVRLRAREKALRASRATYRDVYASSLEWDR